MNKNNKIIILGITLAILYILSILALWIISFCKQNPSYKLSDLKYSDIQNERIISVLEKCGIHSIDSVKKISPTTFSVTSSDYTVLITLKYDDVATLGIIEKANDGTYYLGKTLYEHGKVIGNVQDNTLTDYEKARFRQNSKVIIQLAIKAPSSSKFAPIDDWYIQRDDQIAYVSSYIDIIPMPLDTASKNINKTDSIHRIYFDLIFDKDRLISKKIYVKKNSSK